MNVWGALYTLTTLVSERAPSARKRLVQAVRDKLSPSDRPGSVPLEAVPPVTVTGGTERQPAHGENQGAITVDGTDNRALFDYYKADLSQVESDSNRFLSAFALAALTGAPRGESWRETDDYAVLTNDGEINMNMEELLRQYGPEMVVPGDMENSPGGKTAIRTDSGKKYLAVMLWGMLAGSESTLINNGRIFMDCNTENPEAAESVFTHPMYVYHRSSMINNGEVVVRGNGNRGINPRGLTSQKNDLTVVNNGRIVVDVEKAYISRLLTVAGFGSTILNRGLVSGTSEGSVFGASHTGSSTLVNEGTIDVTTMGVVPLEQIGVLSTFASRTGAYGLSATGADYLMEKLHEKFGVQNWKGQGIVNAGVVKAAVVDGGAADPNSVAAGVLLLDSHAPYNGWYTVRNTGLVRTASQIRPCQENHHCVKRAELVVNCVPMPEKTFPARVRIKEWATELRNFGLCGDLIQAKSDSEDAVTISFEDAELILRPPEHYAAGTAYWVSGETLVAPIDAETLDEAKVQVTGTEYMQFRTEMPDFLAPSVQETARGDYQVSLKLADNPQAQRELLATAVMPPVDFMRANLEALDSCLEETDALDWAGYQVRHCRKDGLRGWIQGCAGGKDLTVGRLLRVGVHAAFARDIASGGIYHSAATLCAALRGVHLSLADGAVRAQISTFTTSGGTDYALPTDTGISLDGRASGDLDGVCASAHLQKQFCLGKNGRLYAEAGASCLRFHKGTNVDWSFKGEALPGYRMEADPVQSLRGHFRLGWEQRGGKDSRASVSLKGSVALKDDAAGARMMNTAFQETIREDPVQFSLYASLCRRMGGWNVRFGFQSCLGKKNRLGLLHVSLQPVKNHQP